MSEFGVSVLPQARRRGFGRRLFEHAMLHARNRGVEHDVHPRAEREHGDAEARAQRRRDVERDGSESEAWLKLPPDSLASHLDEMLVERRPPSSTTG